MNDLSKLGLGTAQWGMDYGIANASGRPDCSEVSNMLSFAWDHGISLLDTAHSYGNAEKVLGEERVISRGFRIVTKTQPIKGSFLSRDDVVVASTAFDESLKRMQTDSVYGLLVHHADNLLSKGGEHLWAVLEERKARGQIQKIGVSVYYPDQLEAILHKYPIDIVQAPVNVYDCRFARTGLFAKAKDNGIEVHARSIFLQGLLLMTPDSLPPRFRVITEHQRRLHREFMVNGLTPLQGCLRYCMLQSHIDYIILGTENARQLQEIVAGLQEERKFNPEFSCYEIQDTSLIDPSKWPPRIEKSVT